MTTRWSHSPQGGVRRVAEGPSRAASMAGALLAIVGTTLALLIIGAMVLPGSGGSDDPAIAVGASSTPAARGSDAVASLPPRGSGAPVSSPVAPAASGVPAASGAPASPGPTPRPRAASPAPSVAPVQVAYKTAAPVTQGGREVGRVTVQAIRQVKKTAVVPADQRLMLAVVRLDARLARLPYDELNFRIEDDNGDRYEPITDAAPEPLGSGTLAPSTERSGQVAFSIPKGRKVVSVVLTDEAGSDLVVFSRAQPTS